MQATRYRPDGIASSTYYYSYIFHKVKNKLDKDVQPFALGLGAGRWQMLTQIMLPLARPSISTIAIFYFMWVWNDFIYPLVYMQDEAKYTVPLGIMFLNGRYRV
ncbi:MAG TPA: ABC transporter permease subunit, partial [Anaerolineales bacterium]